MDDGRELKSFVRGFVAPLLLVLGGGGLLALARATDSTIIGVAGIAFVGVGLVWMFISCVRNGIDFFGL
ncbi:hypothetical protein [Engelhardtia mirabilis]|uniref:Uncharacterized protein n=1 Tax=Engelhardtia mirabilis TaxID=2528011 RepID=A0A518BGV7_9BACT|nr:hypothetical protein Pla133_12770 [Planctomycetes bacterium Pla133]QDV00538.1 hypothetical protein Pla86_12770 [Planctomycetes bacterium Pla86]